MTDVSRLGKANDNTSTKEIDQSTEANLELVGVLEANGYDEAAIAATLREGGVRTLRHGADFTGRPGTQLWICDKHAIKLRTELQPRNAAEARAFILRALEKEHSVGVHHPAKTWFLLYGDPGAPPTIGNMTPRLRPLHRPEQLGLRDDAAYDALLCRMFDLYLHSAAQQDAGLDISLSNFALDEAGQLFYIDDDFYSLDEFNTLCQFLGVLIRGQDNLDEARIEALGRCLREGILATFGDPIWTTVVAQELRGLFIPPARQPLLNSLVKIIAQRPAPKTSGGIRPPSASAEIVLSPQLASSVPSPTMTRETRQLAILGDIHANAPALEAVLAELDRRGIEQGIVVGDIVGYGPHPQECIELLAARPGLRCVKGNHDHAVASHYFALGFSSLAKWVIEWSIEHLLAEHIEFLDQLPLELQEREWLAVHGAPTDKRFFNAYVYDMTYEENLENLAARGIAWCFHGHTHLQKVYFRHREQGDGVSAEPLHTLHDWQRALICPGSVGQPRGGRAGAEFALVNLEGQALEFFRLDYELGRVIADMRRCNFPGTLVERLEGGR